VTYREFVWRWSYIEPEVYQVELMIVTHLPPFLSLSLSLSPYLSPYLSHAQVYNVENVGRVSNVAEAQAGRGGGQSVQIESEADEESRSGRRRRQGEHCRWPIVGSNDGVCIRCARFG
jgi:hypothetical protein